MLTNSTLCLRFLFTFSTIEVFLEVAGYGKVDFNVTDSPSLCAEVNRLSYNWAMKNVSPDIYTVSFHPIRGPNGDGERQRSVQCRTTVDLQQLELHQSQEFNRRRHHRGVVGHFMYSRSLLCPRRCWYALLQAPLPSEGHGVDLRGRTEGTLLCQQFNIISKICIIINEIKY